MLAPTVDAMAALGPSETASSSEDGSLAAASAAQPPRPAKRRLVLVAGEPKKRMANLLTLLLNNKDTPWVRAFADACGLDIADGPRLATSMAKPEARAALKAQPLFYSMDEWLTICAPSKVVLEPSKEAVMTAVIGLDKEAGAPPLEPDTLARRRGVEALRGWKYCLGCHASSQTMKRCGGCKAAYFCGPECQQKAWKRAHKQCCDEWAAPPTFEVADHASIASHHPLDGARVVSLPRVGTAEVAQVVYLPGDDSAYPGGLRLGIRML